MASACRAGVIAGSADIFAATVIGGAPATAFSSLQRSILLPFVAKIALFPLAASEAEIWSGIPIRHVVSTPPAAEVSAPKPFTFPYGMLHVIS